MHTGCLKFVLPTNHGLLQAKAIALCTTLRTTLSSGIEPIANVAWTEWLGLIQE